MITFTEEQASIYETMLEETPSLVGLPFVKVEMHELRGKRIMCLHILHPHHGLSYLHGSFSDLDVKDMAEITMLHNCRRFTTVDAEGYVFRK